MGFTLRETVGLFSDATVTYEPFDSRIFVMRLAMTNHMTREPLEFAFRFVAVDGPEGFGAARFAGPSVVLDHTAINRVEVSADEGAELIFNIRTQVLAMRPQTN